MSARCEWCGRHIPSDSYSIRFCCERCEREYELEGRVDDEMRGLKNVIEEMRQENRRLKEMYEEELDGLMKMHEEGHERLLESDVRLWDGERWVKHILDDTADIAVCNWNRLTGEDWVTLLSERAEFADKCKWRKLNNGDMIRLLSNKPQFSSKFERWDSISHDQWVELLNAQPQFGDKCNCWEFFEDGTVSEILHNLKLISRFGDRLTANQFAHLLIEHPQCAKQFDRWSDVDCEHWYELLLYHPKFVDRCDKLNLFSSKQITTLCKENPELAQAFSLEGLDREDIVSLLKTKKIVFGDKFLSAQESWFWIELLEADESYAEKCDFSVFGSSDWRVLITDNPRFAKYCDMRKLNGDDLLAIAVKHPQFLGCYRKFALKKTLILIFEFVVLMWPRANNTACVTGSKLFDWFSRIFKSLSCCLFFAGFVVGMGYATWLYNSKTSIGIVEVWNLIGNSDLPLKSLILPPICCIVYAYLMVRFDSVRARVHAIVWFVVIQFFLIWVFDVTTIP